jgi:hypothetical protein
MLKNIDTYGDFYKGICLEDNKSKSLEYIKANPNKKYLCYFSNNTKTPTIYHNEHINYNDFPWELYLNINPDVKANNNITKKTAWNHWKEHGLKEGRTFSYFNNSNIHNSRFGNLFFINMFLNLISMKYNLKCSYKNVVQFGKLGIHFYKGTNEYDTHLLVTENNFMHILTNDLEPCNIIITNNVWFQTSEFCKILYKYFKVEKVRNKIIAKNMYNKRYNKNNDLFIHVRLGDVKKQSYDSYDYIDSIISTIEYDEAYITSDNIEDPFCQKLIAKHKLRIYISNEHDTIMFGNTCNNILMSGGTFSWIIGFLAFYSKNIYIPNIINKWYGDIFIYDNWKSHTIVKDTLNEVDKIVDINSDIEPIGLLQINNLICKPIYDNYGLHYCGWKYVMNQFLQNYSETSKNYMSKFLFDEWLEKLLVWGDKKENNMLVNEIKKENLKMITFLHNPPFTKWYNSTYATNIHESIIYNDEHTNINLFKKLEQSKLTENIQYLYTLTCTHKEYLYHMYPNMRTKLVSISHPIEITGTENTFDFALFCQNKQIYHIGWWLRNFQSFINFKIPNEFNKTILIKKGFEEEWNTLSKRFDTNDITIIKEVNNHEYEKIFVNSCMYLDLEDTTANNVILECIKFNTPVIVRKIPAVIEYLGVNYPLYFENEKDLHILESADYLCSMINKTTIYLQNMDKSHILCEAFNNKIKYDIQKAQYINHNHNRYNTETNTQNMTWFCFIDNLDTYVVKLEHLYNNFINQYNYTRHILKIIVSDKLKDNENYDSFICELLKYSELSINITHIVANINDYSDFVNLSFEQCDTPYLTIIGILDKHDPNYSDICCNYLDMNPNIDATFSSYNIIEKDYTECIKFEKNKMIFVSNFSKFLFPNTGIVWRQIIYNLIGSFTNYNNNIYLIRNYLKKCIKSHLNISCCHDVSLYSIS